MQTDVLSIRLQSISSGAFLDGCMWGLILSPVINEPVYLWHISVFCLFALVPTCLNPVLLHTQKMKPTMSVCCFQLSISQKGLAHDYIMFHLCFIKHLLCFLGIRVLTMIFWLMESGYNKLSASLCLFPSKQPPAVRPVTFLSLDFHVCLWRKSCLSLSVKTHNSNLK